MTEAVAPAPAGVEVIARHRAYQGFLALDVVQLRHERFAGGWTPPLRRDLLCQRPAVAILPYDPATDRVLLIRQFRTGALLAPEGPWLWEIPAGLAEEGEALEAAAARELTEECGLTARQLRPILAYHSSPGASTERVQTYLATVDLAGAGGLHGLAHEDEDIQVQVLPAATAFAWVAEDKVTAVTALVALLWLQARPDRPASL